MDLEMDLQKLIDKALASGASAGCGCGNGKNRGVDALEMPVRLPQLRQNPVLPAVHAGLRSNAALFARI